MPLQYNKEQGNWTVDKHIPVAVLVVIVLQTVGIIIWAVSFEATTITRLAVLEKQVDALSRVNERLGRLEVITGNNSEILKELRTHIITNNHQTK